MSRSALDDRKRRAGNRLSNYGYANDVPKTVGQQPAPDAMTGASLADRARIFNEQQQAGSGASLPDVNPTPAPSPSGNNAVPEANPPAATTQSEQGEAGGAGSSADRLLQNQGKPDEIVTKMGVGEAEDAIEASIGHVQKGSAKGAIGGYGGGFTNRDPDIQKAYTVDQKERLNEALSAQGAPPQKALEQIRDQKLARYQQLEKDGLITKEVHTKLKDRWKNIFNVIPKEDFGMVLMDFGFRAMLAGETMGTMGALGAAGMGAMAGVENRKNQAYERALAQEKMAGEEARADMTTINDTRAEDRLQKAQDNEAPELKDTEQGVWQYKPDHPDAIDGWVLMKDAKGNPIMPSSLSGKPPVDKWRIDQLVAMGFTEEKAKRFVILGQDPQRARELAYQAWQRFENDDDATITIGGNNYTKRKVRKADLGNLRERFFEESLGVLGISPEDIGGGALTDNGGDPVPDPTMPDPNGEKPPGWNEDQWKRYQDHPMHKK